MDTRIGLNLLQTELLKDELITKTIEKMYGQKAQLNILNEEKTDDYFIRTLTLDILDHHFGFAPVAYCIVSISNIDHIDNLDEYHIVEKSCKECQIVFDSLIDNSNFPEVKNT